MAKKLLGGADGFDSLREFSDICSIVDSLIRTAAEEWKRMMDKPMRMDSTAALDPFKDEVTWWVGAEKVRSVEYFISEVAKEKGMPMLDEAIAIVGRLRKVLNTSSADVEKMELKEAFEFYKVSTSDWVRSALRAWFSIIHYPLPIAS